MNLDLSEFVGTLCIGGGVILVAIIFFRVYCDTEIATLVDRVDGRLLGNPFLLTIAAFTLGMIAEDVSDNYVDTDGHFFQQKLDFPQEWELRNEILFGMRPLEAGPALANAKALPVEWGMLGRLYARLDLIRKQDQEFGGKVQAAIEQGTAIRFDELPSKAAFRQSLKSLVNGLYYHAKNVSYTQPNYFSELSLIQNRIDFARSLAVLSVVFGLAVAVAFSIRMALSATQLWIFRTPDRERTLKTMSNIAVSSVCLLGLAGVAYLAARNAYTSEEMEFNRRAFGYYASMKQEEESSASPAAAISMQSAPLQ